MKRETAILVTTLLFFLFVSVANAETVYISTFNLKKDVNSLITDYILNVTVKDETYSYYKGLSHKVLKETDLAKFVTAGPVKPISDLLLTVYNDSEDFVNAVLMMMHQIEYVESLPKYAVEYLVEMQGDCEVSYLAASLTLAANIKTVLLLWKINATVGHVNLGVSLSHEPRYSRKPVYSVTYNGEVYYVAECTGGNWENGWRVGELPNELSGLSPIVVPLSVSLDAPAGVVDAYFNVQQSISYFTVERFVPLISYYYIEGVLNPSISGETVNLYVVVDGFNYKLLGSTVTDFNGRFVFKYLPLLYYEINFGKLVLTFNGNMQFKGSTYTLTLFNFLDIFVYCPFYVLLCILILVFTLIKSRG